MMMRRLFLSCAALLALSACAIDDKLPQPEKLLRVSTGSYGGVYYPYGVSACRLWNADQSLSTTRCLVQTSAGSGQNIARLKDGQVDFALVQADVLAAEIERERQAGRESSLRVVIAGPQEALTVIVNPASGITNASGLKGKRIALGPQGSGQRATAQRLFDSLGINIADVQDVPALTSGQQARLLCTGELDAALYVSAPPSGYVAESASACGGIILSLDEAVRNGMIARNPHFKHMVVKRDEYRGQVADINTIGVGSLVVTRADQSADNVYRLTRLLVGQVETFKRQHQALRDTTAAAMAATPAFVQRHPAAERYLREARLLP